MTLYPIGYGAQMVSMAALRARHEPRMHPEFARRLFAWLERQEGRIGIGGGWRATGEQPDKPGFAPEGQSFHQSQQFPSGLWYAAVDLVVAVPGRVHRAPTWSEVPAQGSAAAVLHGVHCNVSSEAWHMQPVELDGWRSWVNAGRPDLRPNYPLASDEPEQIPPEDEVPSFQTIPSRKLIDTRELNGPPAEPGQLVTVAVPGAPEWAKGVAVNIVATETRGPGFVTAWSGGPRPDTSNVNYTLPGQTVACQAFVPIVGGQFVVSPAVSGCHIRVTQEAWTA